MRQVFNILSAISLVIMLVCVFGQIALFLVDATSEKKPKFAGFMLENGAIRLPGGRTFVPALIGMGASVLPIIWIIRRQLDRASQYEKPTHCPNCEYDLRATPYQCPECGTRFDNPSGED